VSRSDRRSDDDRVSPSGPSLRVPGSARRTALPGSPRRSDLLDVWAPRCNAVPVAGVAAYSSYQAGVHTIIAADPLPDDLRLALECIHGGSGAH
jgi:hypothetical protein